jgi:hypothetical protein
VTKFLHDVATVHGLQFAAFPVNYLYFNSPYLKHFHISMAVYLFFIFHFSTT